MTVRTPAGVFFSCLYAVPTVLLILLMVGIPSHAGEVNFKKLNRATWLNVETEHFSVISDGSEKKALAMARELERFRYFVSAILDHEQHPIADKVPIVLARKESTLRAMGVPSRIGGFFVPGENIIIADASSFSAAEKGRTSRGRHVILHELVHLLNQNEAMGLANPPWYNEGIAEYFATYVQKKDQIILGDLSFLKFRFSGPLAIESESLFKTAQHQLPSGKRLPNKFYARAVAVVHYLNADPERRREMYIYLMLIHKGYGVNESFDHAFKMSFSDLDDLVEDYLESRHVMGRVFPVGPGGVEFPSVTHTARTLGQKDAMRILVPKIAYGYLSDDEREKMQVDLERFYPDLKVPDRRVPDLPVIEPSIVPAPLIELMVERVVDTTPVACIPPPDLGFNPGEAFHYPVFVRGQFNDWVDPPVTPHNFVNNGNQTYTARFEMAAGKYRYKIASTDWSVQYVDTRKPTVVGTRKVFKLGFTGRKNSSIRIDVDGCYLWTIRVIHGTGH